MPKLTRIVNDTNVWLSALYFLGKPAQIVNLIEEDKIVSVISKFILSEITEKMIINFDTPSFAANATVSYIESMSELVDVKGVDYELRDPEDNKVLETGVRGRCNWLITGDKDLLTLKEYGRMRIVKPEQFLANYGH